jgi:hypothetical protein
MPPQSRESASVKMLVMLRPLDRTDWLEVRVPLELHGRAIELRAIEAIDRFGKYNVPHHR